MASRAIIAVLAAVCCICVAVSASDPLPDELIKVNGPISIQRPRWTDTYEDGKDEPIWWTWDSPPVSSRINLYWKYSLDTYWNTIDTYVQNTGSYWWRVPYGTDGRVTVKVSSWADSSVYATSEYFDVNSYHSSSNVSPYYLFFLIFVFFFIFGVIRCWRRRFFCFRNRTAIYGSSYAPLAATVAVPIAQPSAVVTSTTTYGGSPAPSTVSYAPAPYPYPPPSGYAPTGYQPAPPGYQTAPPPGTVYYPPPTGYGAPTAYATAPPAPGNYAPAPVYYQQQPPAYS